MDTQKQAANKLCLAAKELRTAQRDYMKNRGNDDYGKIVAEKATALDAAIEAYEKSRT